jgi:hypothetical protein
MVPWYTLYGSYCWWLTVAELLEMSIVASELLLLLVKGIGLPLRCLCKFTANVPGDHSKLNRIFVLVESADWSETCQRLFVARRA